MDWTSNDKTVTLLHGDCLVRIRDLPEHSVHAVMTSPPYFALRSYLSAGHPDKASEIGSEPTPEAFIATMVAVFREVHRVLRDDGFCWINLGETMGDGNQLLIPHRVALALQADGWILRDTIIWSKRSPMPQSVNGWRWTRCRVKVAPQVNGEQRNAGRVTAKARDCIGGEWQGSAKWADCPGCDKCIPNGGYVLRRGQGRTTTAHEYLFLFVKSNAYFWDMENCREPALNTCTGRTQGRKWAGVGDEVKSGRRGEFNGHGQASRIPRSVLTLSSEPSKFAHFATYPSALVKFCLNPLSPKGCCPACGAQWAPVVDSVTETAQVYGERSRECFPGRTGNGVQKRASEVPAVVKVLGYRPTCTCPEHEPGPCRVLDPFSGTGTTGQTARFLGHHYVGIELNEKYLEHAKTWIFQAPRWHIREQTKATKRAKPQPSQRALGFMDQPA